MDKTSISKEEQELMDNLDLPKHVQHAFIKILETERLYKKSDIHCIKDIILKSCQDRSELYWKYNI